MSFFPCSETSFIDYALNVVKKALFNRQSETEIGGRFMFTYVKLTQNGSTQLYYVQVEIKAGKIILTDVSGLQSKVLLAEDICELDWQVFDEYYGGRRFSFGKGEMSCQVYEAGLAVIDYLYQQLQVAV